MASRSRSFQKPKGAQEERNLIQNAIPKSARAVTKWSVKIFVEWQNGRKNKYPAIEPCAFTTDKSKVQCLDTGIGNMKAESLKIKFTVKVVETTLNMEPPFVVTVACR